MRLWDDELEGVRDKIRAEAKEFVAFLPAVAGTGSASERVQGRRVAESSIVMRSEMPVDRVIDGPAGGLRLRIFHPESVAGALLHIHGGGWVAGEPEVTDLLNEALSRELQLAVVSVDYRLAPEHPYPAAVEDCEAAALWLVENAAAEFGTDRLLVGGESAGAHLSVVTLLRLRDRHQAAGRFCGANLVFGAYDLGHSPSARRVRTDRAVDILNPEEIRFVVEQFAPGLSPEERRSSDLSPIYADLQGMPPALFTVGTADHLVDDTLFLASRWMVAGNEAELLVYPDAPHACIGLPTVLTHWWPRLSQFLWSCIRAPEGRDTP